jgi:hypothetical protein
LICLFSSEAIHSDSEDERLAIVPGQERAEEGNRQSKKNHEEP